MAPPFHRRQSAAGAALWRQAAAQGLRGRALVRPSDSSSPANSTGLTNQGAAGLQGGPEPLEIRCHQAIPFAIGDERTDAGLLLRSIRRAARRQLQPIVAAPGCLVRKEAAPRSIRLTDPEFGRNSLPGPSSPTGGPQKCARECALHPSGRPQAAAPATAASSRPNPNRESPPPKPGGLTDPGPCAVVRRRRSCYNEGAKPGFRLLGAAGALSSDPDNPLARVTLSLGLARDTRVSSPPRRARIEI